jgi:glycosyltransferase involved in cell wall biosynthesis
LPETYWQRLREEWELADAVLVNSDWSRDALIEQGVPGRKIMVVPLAINIHHEHLGQPIKAVGRLKVIWLGSVILRKGIQYLIEAARLLVDENIEFILAGPIGISAEVCKSFPANVKILGRVTRDQLTLIYQQGHIFVLPTVSDGFAITQLEAMAHGLPVIATPNCGRVVTDGVDGLVVPARDSVALAAALARLNADRQLIAEMSRNALETIKLYDLPSNGWMINAATEARRLDNNPSGKTRENRQNHTASI